MWPAPVQEADRAGAARSAMWGIGQARRHTLSASSTGPSGCLSAGISSVGRLKFHGHALAGKRPRMTSK